MLKSNQNKALQKSIKAKAARRKYHIIRPRPSSDAVFAGADCCDDFMDEIGPDGVHSRISGEFFLMTLTKSEVGTIGQYASSRDFLQDWKVMAKHYDNSDVSLMDEETGKFIKHKK